MKDFWKKENFFCFYRSGRRGDTYASCKAGWVIKELLSINQGSQPS